MWWMCGCVDVWMCKMRVRTCVRTRICFWCLSPRSEKPRGDLAETLVDVEVNQVTLPLNLARPQVEVEVKRFFETFF